MFERHIDERSQCFIDLTRKYAARNYNPYELAPEWGEGVWVRDPEGNTYLDCLAMYSAANHGHRHPRIIAAVKAQLDKITAVSRAYCNPTSALYYEKLAKLCSEKLRGENMLVHPMNGGVEAPEKAIYKISRKWGYTVKGIPEDQAEHIFFTDNFHGRTLGAISGSTEPEYRKHLGPFVPGIVFAKYGDIASLRKAITRNTASVIIEPIQGEGGVIVPPDGYLQEVRNLCTSEDVAMIDDEIQAGLGRTGYMLACEHENVKPDMVCVGKALCGGIIPGSAVVGSKEFVGVLKEGDDGSTFGGYPLAAAAARESIDVILEENLCERSRDMGAYFMEGLQALSSPHVKEVRGRGLFIGVEIMPSAGSARSVCERLLDVGIMSNAAHPKVFRITPPLVITENDIDWGLERIGYALSRI